VRGSPWWERELSRAEREMERLSARHLEALRRELDEARSLALRELLAARGEWTRGRLESVLRRIDAALEQVQRRLQDSVGSMLDDAARSGLERVDRAVDRYARDIPVMRRELPGELYLDLWADFTLDLVKRDIVEPIRTGIRNTIRAGFITGRSLYETMREVASGDFHKLTFASKFHRAEAIVRTETNRVANRAAWLRVAQYQREAPRGEVWKKRWGTAGDDRVRPTHVEAGLQPPVPVNEPFYVGGHPCQHPVDPALPPEEAVNCRCSLLAVPPGLE